MTNTQPLVRTPSSVEHGIAQPGKLLAWETATTRIAALTPRQRQIMNLILAGHPNKNIAADLGISRRTVETHRALIMKRTGVKSLPALVRLALIAENFPGDSLTGIGSQG